jgi:hypothetical protein
MMDWKATDPQALQATPTSAQESDASRTSEAGTSLSLQTETPAPIARFAYGIPLLGGNDRGIGKGSPVEKNAGRTEAAALVTTSEQVMPSPPGSLELHPAVTADIWQRLSRLVAAPARFDGLWPFVMPVASLALFVSIVQGSGWLMLPWALLLAAGFKVNSVNSAQEYARHALNMAPFDLRWVGPLTQALNSPHPRVRGVAAQMLTHLLPHLHPAANHLLNAQQRAYLNQSLFRNRRRDAELNKAILTAWAVIGDAEAIPYIERITHNWAYSAGQKEVRDMARKCLPRLEQRLAEEHAALMMGRNSPEQIAASAAFAQAELSASTQAAIANVDAQLDKLREERRKHSNPGMRLGFLIASWVFIVPYTAYMACVYFFGQGGDWHLGLLWTFLALCATQLHRLALSNKQSEAAKQLAQTDDIRAVGPLTEALEWPDASIQRTAADGLTRLLPRLTASDANLLNSKHRVTLYKLLRMRNAGANERLLLSILRALQQVGDEAAIPVVERLSNAHAYTQRQRNVKQMATDTLPLLQSTARNVGSSAMLLRASSANETPSDLLLRGAMASPEEAPQQLLRASAVDEGA